MASVFISYRRSDSLATTKRIAWHLQRLLGKRNVFIDIDSIASGDVFPQRLQVALQRADVILVVIGPHWAAAADAAGQPRLVNPADFVRLEVATALASGKAVIPLLVDGATFTPAELPPDLVPLLQHPALTLAAKTLDGAAPPLALRQAQSQAFRAELRRMPRIPYPLIGGAALLAALGGLLVLSEPYVSLFAALTGLASKIFGYALFIGVVIAGARALQDRLWGWFAALALVVIGPLVAWEFDHRLQVQSGLWDVAMILLIAGLSLSGQRVARYMAIWRTERAIRKG